MRIDINPAVDIGAKMDELIRQAKEQLKLAKAREIGVGEKSPEQKALMNGEKPCDGIVESDLEEEQE
jgi:hypothetical protein